jgi:MoxR-like ATPase
MEAVSRLLAHSRAELSKAVVGQQELLEQCLVTILAGGHALIEGVPGIAKTLVVKALALLLRIHFQRVQCTSDLMPADLLGANILNLASGTFTLHRGPLFTDLLLVDEVNRMPPRTQAALLEAMEERQITLDGTRYRLNELFTVFATQNPIEFEGTYPLPEAQLDRFLLKIKATYPDAAGEVAILEKHHNGFEPRNLEDLGIRPVELEVLTQARQELKKIRVEPALFEYLTNIVRRSRDWPSLSLGASPRAALSLMAAAKAYAAMEARDFLIPDDVKQAALPVLRHRIILKPEAELEGIDADRVIGDVLAAVEVPK